MIKEIICYTVICDRCGTNYYDGSCTVGYTDAEISLDEAIDEGNWKEIEEKHYCLMCYDYDDNDNLIVKERK